jgi:hypothetical protein
MTHYGFTKKFFKEQNEGTLKDWGKKLTGILLSIETHSIYWDENTCKNMIEDIQNMTKKELIDYCYETVDNILDTDIGNYSTFFWNDGGSDSGEEYLYDIINEKNDLLDDFIHSDYLESFWENEIKNYKLERIWSELTDEGLDFPIETSKDQILNIWLRYKLSHGKVELFDGEVGDPYIDDNKKRTV